MFTGKHRCLCMDTSGYAKHRSLDNGAPAKCKPKAPTPQTKEAKFCTQALELIAEEVDKFLDAGFIKKTSYLWISNMIMVKINGEWQICINFTNLN